MVGGNVIDQKPKKSVYVSAPLPQQIGGQLIA